MSNAIELVSQARGLLEQAREPEQWLEVQRLAAAAKAFLRGRDEAHAAVIAAGEIELRAKKKLADFIAAQPKAKSANPNPPKLIGGSHSDPRLEAPKTEAVKLADLGIQKGKDAQEYRKLAAVPEATFESRIKEAVEEQRMPTVAAVTTVSASKDYDGDTWGTPLAVIERAREVMGGIDCDPATNEQAQKTVQATRYYTKETNGLEQPWGGRVWLNPPYSTSLVKAFAKRVLEHDFDQCIVLVNNCTDAGWWHSLAEKAAVTAFTRGRISFVHPQTGEAFATRQGQTLFYFGGESARFADVFSRDGACAIFARLL